MVTIEDQDHEIPGINPDQTTWFFDILGSYDEYSRFKVPKWIAGYGDTLIRYDHIGYYDNVSRMKPDMSRYRDPENEPQAPETEYSEDNPPLVFVDPRPKPKGALPHPSRARGGGGRTPSSSVSEA